MSLNFIAVLFLAGLFLLFQDASKSYALSAQDFSLLPLKSV